MTTSSEGGGVHTGGGAIIEPRRGVVLGAVSVLVVVLLLTGVGVLGRTVAGNSAIEGNRAELRAQAGVIVQAVFSVDGSRWQADRRHARQLVTGDFADVHAAQLQQPPSDGIASVTWHVEEVALIGVGVSDATALVRARIATTPKAGSATEEDRTLRTAYVESGGRWRLAAAEVLE
ncbi:hypothetical protein [Gordonia sp. NPDC003429]